MEEHAREMSFPIIPRETGLFLSLISQTSNASTVFEFGSGFGYSAYWFIKGMGPKGRVFTSDAREVNHFKLRHFLESTGYLDQIEPFLGWAKEHLEKLDSQFDIIYNDGIKKQYEQTWLLARKYIRPAGSTSPIIVFGAEK